MYTPKGKKIKVDKEIAETESLINTTTGLPYKGEYVYNAQDGSYTDPSGLITLENTDADSSISPDEVNLIPTKYDDVIKQQRVYDLRYTRTIPTYIPSPTNEEYINQSFNRFFTQHRQTGEILEVSQRVFAELSSNSTKYHFPSYMLGSMLWRLRGPVANQDINGYIVEGAAEINTQLILELEKVLPNIRTYLTDPTQFVK